MLLLARNLSLELIPLCIFFLHLDLFSFALVPLKSPQSETGSGPHHHFASVDLPVLSVFVPIHSFLFHHRSSSLITATYSSPFLAFPLAGLLA